jgi:hypothetical protein
MDQTLSRPVLRGAALLVAALLVSLLVCAALFVRVALRNEEQRAAPAQIESMAAPPRVEGRAPTRQAAQRAAVAVSTPAPIEAAIASPRAAPLLGLMASQRCELATTRRDHPELCAGYDGRGASGQIAVRPVEEVVTRGVALRRAVGNAVNARAGEYALGEAQKYADPRDDPLFDKGTDPATAAMRPCAAGELPQGAGAHLTGRTCQPMR